MKRILSLLGMLVLVAQGAEAPVKIERLETTDGKVFVNVTVRKVESDGISVMHSSGAAKIPFDKMALEMQKLFGYDPATAQKLIQEQKVKTFDALPLAKRWIISPREADGISVQYRDYRFLREEKESLLRRELLPDDKIADGLTSIPRGGIITITVERPTIGAANTEYFLAIVTDANGSEIMRRIGPDHVANVPREDCMWWNLFSIWIAREFDDSVRLRVVDRLGNKNVDFTIKKATHNQ